MRWVKQALTARGVNLAAAATGLAGFRTRRAAATVTIAMLLAIAASTSAQAQEAADVASLNKQAVQLYGQGKHKEAAAVAEKAFAVAERVLGKEHPDTLLSVNNLAALYQAQGRYGEAEPLYKRALEAYERVLGKEHPDALTSVNNLAGLYFTQRDWSRAAQFWRRSTAAIAARPGRHRPSRNRKKEKRRGAIALAILGPCQGGTPSRVGRGHTEFVGLAEMFLTAQWAAGSEAAQSLAQMAARGAAGKPALALLARERQNLVAAWQKRDALRNAWLGQESAKRNPQAEAENDAKLAAIDARIKEIDKELAAKFPDFAALSSLAPLGAEEVQAQLGPDEALVLFLDTPEWQPALEETFIWVVTKTELRWVRSDLGTEALAREVQALRCGLDAEAWAGPALHGTHRSELYGRGPECRKAAAFDRARAFRLYQALFGQAEDLIKGKQLLIVPSGALT